MSEDQKKELLIRWYKDAVERYAEALQNDVQNDWEEEFGTDSWDDFHELDGKLKVKFYYEGEE